MLGSPGLDSLSGASDSKYPGDCYSPKFVDQRDTYRGKSPNRIIQYLSQVRRIRQAGHYPKEKRLCK